MKQHLHLPDEAATDALAAVLAQAQPRPAVVYLHGELGAGKSTLARAWLRELGVRGAVRSPTYTLVERYALAADAAGRGGEALHIDLYRIATAGELEFLGLDDDGVALWLVEWPERGGSALPAADLQVELRVAGSGRDCALLATSPAGEAWLASNAVSVGLRPFAEP